MRRLVVIVALVCALAASAGPASAHGNHLTVTDQYAADGTIVVESLFTSSDGFVVLHADDDGEPGRPIGHARVGFGFETGLRVPIDGNGRSTGERPTTLWAVLHRDDGDGRFEPESDEPVPGFGGQSERSFAVGTRPAGRAVVVAADFGSQKTTGSVTIDRAVLGHDGAVVVRADRNGEPGRVVGRRSLTAGGHENVSVALNRSYYRHRGTRFGLWAALDERGSPVRIEGSVVASELAVRKTGGETAARADHRTRSQSNGEGSAEPNGASGTDGPGFGIVAGVLAVVLTALGFAPGRSG